MDISKSNIKCRAIEILGFIARYWLAIVAVSCLTLFIVSNLQSHLDRRALEQQNEKLAQFERDKKFTQEQTQKLLDIFNQQHDSTLKILDALNEVSGTVSKLVENDRRQDAAMINLKGEYLNATNPNNQTKENINLRAARRAVPVRRREQDVLSTDAELYPNGAGN